MTSGAGTATNSAGTTINTGASTAGRDAIDRTTGRAITVFRGTWSLATPFLAFAAGPLGGLRLAAVLAVLAWGGFLVWRGSTARLPHWLALPDAALYAVLLLLVGDLVPADRVGAMASWVNAGASISVLIATWLLRPVAAVAVSSGLIVAHLAGVVAAPGDPPWTVGVQTVAVLVLQCALGLGVQALLRRDAATADGTVARLDAVRHDYSVSQARLLDWRRQRHALQDTVLNALTVVAQGSLADRPDEVRARCRRDLAALLAESDGETGGRRVPTDELAADLIAEANVRGLHVRSSVPADLPELPVAVGAAMTSGMRAALGTASRSRVIALGVRRIGPAVSVRLRWLADRQLAVDPVAGRMAAAGGSARLRSGPGRFRTLELHWAPADAADTPSWAGEVADVYAAGMARAMAVVALSWHLLCLPLLLFTDDAYRALPVAIGAWAVVLAAAVALALRVPGRGIGARTARLVTAGLVGVGVVALGALSGGGLVGYGNWAISSVGWVLMVLAVYRPAGELVAGLTVLSVAYLAITFADYGGQAEPLSLAVGLLTFVLVLQGGTLAVLRVLRTNAAAAAGAAAEMSRLAGARQAVDAVRRDRMRRNRELGAVLLPLVRALADGSADPADRAVQRRCAVEASVLRALIEQADRDAPVPSMEAVAAFTAVALRRGIALQPQVTDDFAGAPEGSRDAVQAMVVVALELAGPGRTVVTLDGTPDRAVATVCCPLGPRLAAAEERLRAAARRLPDGAHNQVRMDIEETGDRQLWIEIEAVAAESHSAA